MSESDIYFYTYAWLTFVVLIIFVWQCVKSSLKKKKTSGSEESTALREKSEKYLTEEKEDHWMSFSLDTFLRYQDSGKNLRVADENADDWKQKFLDSSMLTYIHYRSRKQLMIQCWEIKDAASTQPEAVLALKRLITASAVIFDYDVPKSIWMFDDNTVSFIYCYLSYTRKMRMSEILTKYNSNPVPAQYTVYSAEELSWYESLVDRIPDMIRIYSDMPEKRRHASLTSICKHVQYKHLDLWAFLKKDETNLAKLITLTCDCLGYNVPADCVSMDDWIYDHVQNEGRYVAKTNPTDDLNLVSNQNPPATSAKRASLTVIK
jgi:hypothetical protein